MFRPPDHNHNLSMRLSAVLHDIGVTEYMVKKRRRAMMINEPLLDMPFLLRDMKIKTHAFGSQSEASTTLGMKSDTDCLFSFPEILVVQDWSEWQPNREHQYLMVQDETTSPGYCLLQLLRKDAPLPAVTIPDEDHITDRIGRVLLTNKFMNHRFMSYAGSLPAGDTIIYGRLTLHGPALTYRITDFYDYDLVTALHCRSWPREAGPWLHQQNVSGWPTEDMKRYSAQQGCFVVQVSSRTGINQDLEWRISTSYAERCMMYNLNITQIGCYILMKMIIKTFVKPKCGEVVSSFMCKNVLFFCIAGSEVSVTWNEGSLLTLLNQCLQSLFQCILTENCPHFVIPGNNLLAGKLSAEVKFQLTDVMSTLTGNIEQALLSIQIDDLGKRLHVKSGHLQSGVVIPNEAVFTLAFSNMIETARCLHRTVSEIQKNIFQNVDANDQNYSHTVSKLCQLYAVGSQFEKVAIGLLTPFLCTSIGSIRASADIHHTRAISSEAFRWFSLGSNSDFSSGRLKQASALYCTGDLARCETILTAVRERLSLTTVINYCSCSKHTTNAFVRFGKLCYENNEDMIKHNIAFCVQFLQSEFNCIPRELVYEMFRTTEEDRPYRTEVYNYWMDWAVTDSLPYLFFLQFKVYSQLHRPAEQQSALNNLATVIHTDVNLGHRETALNLLGQCMVQEGRHQEALNCYVKSLEIRRRNNAAKWHLCMLLVRLLRR